MVTNTYWKGFPEGKAQEISKIFPEKYIFFFEDRLNKRIMIDKKDSEYFKNDSNIDDYINIIENEGFQLVGLKLPLSNTIYHS